MGSLKTIAFLAALAAVPVPLMAGTSTLNVFSSCVGRLSAQIEHHWLLRDGGAKRIEAYHREMVTILDALGADQSSFEYRIAAKQAHAALLNRATFNTSQDDAVWAAKRAERAISDCTRLIFVPTVLKEQESNTRM